MRRKIICLKCASKMKTMDRGNDASTGKYFLRMKCTNPKCKAIYRMEGRSHREVMSKLIPVQKKMQQAQREAAVRREELNTG